MTTAPRPAHLLLLSVLACSSAERDTTERAVLPEGVVARVGQTDVAAETVERIAKAQQVSVQVAVERAISDAVLALAVSSEPAVAVASRAAHARALVEAVQAAARAAGPATDEEIAKLTAERWPELDRPEAVRTTHAVALAKKPEERRPARELAERVARHLAGIRDYESFVEKARELEGGPIQLKVERLPPLTPDGRSFDPDGGDGQLRFDADYTRAAHALATPGDQSPVIETPFGYHVILLEERLPELRVPLEERRQLLEPVVFTRRAERELSTLLASLRASTALEVSRAAERLTAEVSVSP